MDARFVLVFDEVILTQLKKLGENKPLRELLAKMFNKMELLGPRAGELVDSQLFLYEIKSKHPPLRLYYRHIKESDELQVFEFEMKTSAQKQQNTINKLRQKARE